MGSGGGDLRLNSSFALLRPLCEPTSPSLGFPLFNLGLSILRLFRGANGKHIQTDHPQSG